jgi:hypothetical protein
MRDRLQFLNHSYPRSGLACLALFAAASAILTLARSDRTIALVQNFAVLFFLAVIVLLWLNQESFAESTRDSEIPLNPVLMFVLPALAYLPALSVYFVSDDFEHLQIARLPLLHFVGQQLIRGQVTASGYHLFFRPLGFASLFIDYRLFHSWAPGYHLVNLALHLVVVAGVYFLALQLGFSPKMSTVAAVLFSVAPVTVQPVTYIAARFDLIATALGIWSLVAYLHFRKSSSLTMYAVALLLFFLATFAKESIYVLPLLIVWLELTVMPRRHWKADCGFFAVAAATFAYRWHVLHGIGGYQNTTGSPAVLTVGRKALAAVLIRGPAETLLGYNWHQPPLWRIIGMAAATTAVLLCLVLLSRPDRYRRRLAWFALGWIVLAVLPAHSLLWTADVALLWSRVLYISAIGLAILLAALLSGIPDLRLRRAWTLLLLICFLLGLWHNLSAWRSNTRITHQFFAELQHLEPSPPRNSEFLISDMPIELCGVRFFLTGLTPAIQLAYGREDLTARRTSEPASQQSRHTIALQWTGLPSALVEPIKERQNGSARPQ